jgi:hypothetical protein
VLPSNTNAWVPRGRLRDQRLGWRNLQKDFRVDGAGGLIFLPNLFGAY